MKKKNQNEILEEPSTKFIKEYHINPLEKRIIALEERLSPDTLRKFCKNIFDEKIRDENFTSKVKSIFNQSLKIEIFINKVKAISRKVISDYVDKTRIKTGFWIFSLIVAAIVAAIIGIILQKFFNLF